MKLLPFLLFLVLPLSASSQTDEVHMQMMDKFVRYYNENLTDSICTLFPDRTDRPGEECFWRWADQQRSTIGEYGKITSYEYLGRVSKGELTVFRITTQKKEVKALSFDLHDGKFGTFRFDTMDDEIALMLKKAKK